MKKAETFEEKVWRKVRVVHIYLVLVSFVRLFRLTHVRNSLISSILFSAVHIATSRTHWLCRHGLLFGLGD